MTYSQLYYMDASSTAGRTTACTGDPDIEAMLQGDPKCWNSPDSEKQLKPKTLIISDWSMNSWLYDKREKFTIKCQELIKKGFTIYVWNGDQAVPIVTLDDIENLFLTKRNPIDKPDLIKAVLTQKSSLSEKQLLVLDDHAVECLLEDKDALPRSLSLDVLQQSLDPKKVIDFLKKSDPPVTVIVQDVFNTSLGLFVENIIDQFEGAVPKDEYVTLQLTQNNNYSIQNEFFDMRQYEDSRHFVRKKFSLDELMKIKNLKMDIYHEERQGFLEYFIKNNLLLDRLDIQYFSSDCVMPLKNLKYLSVNSANVIFEKLSIGSSNALITLKLSGDIDGDCSWISDSVFENLEQFHCGVEDFGGDISAILNSSPKLKILKISMDDCLRGKSCSLKSKNLQELIVSDGVNAGMTVEQFYSLVEGQSSLKKITLNEILTPLFFHKVPCDFKSLEYLTLLNVNISMDELSRMIVSCRCLKEININDCFHFSKNEKTCFPKLQSVKSIRISDRDMSERHFVSLVGNCENLENLEVYDCSALEETEDVFLNFKKLKNLKILCDFNLKILKAIIKNALDLESLCVKITKKDEQLTALLKNLSKLKVLDLSGLVDLFDKPVGFKYLEKLLISNACVTPQSLQNIIENCDALKVLTLTSVFEFPLDLVLKKESKLEAFNCVSSDLNNNILKSILKSSKCWKTIYLFGCTKLIFDEELCQLLKCTGLFDDDSIMNLKQLNMPQNRRDSDQEIPFSLDPIDPIGPIDPIAKPHLLYNPDRYKDFNPKKDPFKFNGKWDANNLSHSMALDKISQYFTVTKKHLEIVGKIQDGCCSALAVFFKTDQGGLRSFLNAVNKWDGKKESLTEALKQQFEKFHDNYLLPYQLNQTYKTTYIGDSLDDFLNGFSQGQSEVLSNAWHAITIVKVNVDRWSIYDPNDFKGPNEHRLISKEDLKKYLLEDIGKNSSLACFGEEWFTPDVTKLVTNPNDFLKNGGLFDMARCTNGLNILEQIQNHDFSIESLDGLLLRNISGTPAWAVGLHSANKKIKVFALKLTTLLKKKYPNGEQLLVKSLEALNEKQRHEIMTTIVTIHSDSDSELELEPRSEEPLLDLIRAIPKKPIEYEQSLNTWDHVDAETNPLKYCQECLNGEHKKRLIEVNSAQKADNAWVALLQYCKLVSRPVFYVDSPEDLICSAPTLIRQTDGSGLIQSNARPLSQFLKKQGAEKPIIIVNYNNFTPEEIVQTNTLLDETRLLDNGEALPVDAVILGITNTKSPHYYSGSDFYSRFDHVDAPIVFDEAAVKISEPLVDEKPNHSIDLFHSMHWKERLLGHWVFKGDHLFFEKGALAGLENSDPCVLEIKNGPWEDPEFQRFWLKLQAGVVQIGGQWVQIPKNIQIVKKEGYDWDLLQKQLFLTESMPDLIKTPVNILNPGRLSTFVGKHTYNEKTEAIELQAGLLKQAHDKGQLSLPIYLTRSLSEDSWAFLLTEALKLGITLTVCCAPGVQMPLGLSVMKPLMSLPLLKLNRDCQIINSNDTEASIAAIKADGQEWTVIDVSECQSSDLLGNIDGALDKDALKFTFNQTVGVLTKHLLKNENIILKGRFSKALADALAPVLLDQGQKPTAQVRIVTENDDLSFQYMPQQESIVRVEDKKSLLQWTTLDPTIRAKLEPLIAVEPFVTLQARLAILKAFPDSQQGDEAWVGMKALTLETDVLWGQNRKQDVDKLLACSPYVLLTGLSGVGKSTFVEKELCNAEDKLHTGEEAVLSWATDSVTKGRKILFLDEATLSQKGWSEFEGLYNDPPSILIKGVVYPLTTLHKVVFAGNPVVSYGGERQLAPFFERHGNAVVFTPLSNDVIGEKILNPIFQGTPGIDEASIKEIIGKILHIYQFVVSKSNQEVLISPREIEMMAIIILRKLKEGQSSEAIRSMVERVCYDFAAPLLVSEDDQKDFKQQFQPKAGSMELDTAFDPAGFLVTPSRRCAVDRLNDFLNVREWRSESTDLNEVQTYGGLGGLILEGNPGAGKSKIVIQVLSQRGYKEIKQFDEIPVDQKIFCRIFAVMSIKEKEKRLQWALDAGAVVVWDEINSNAMMEKRLNAALMSKQTDGGRPMRPGFMIVGTGNPRTMSGRNAVPLAIARRTCLIDLPDYTEEELAIILRSKKIPPEEASFWAKAYCKQLKYARVHGLTPEPTFRKLLGKAGVSDVASDPDVIAKPEMPEKTETTPVMLDLEIEAPPETPASEGSDLETRALKPESKLEVPVKRSAFMRHIHQYSIYKWLGIRWLCDFLVKIVSPLFKTQLVKGQDVPDVSQDLSKNTNTASPAIILGPGNGDASPAEQEKAALFKKNKLVK